MEPALLNRLSAIYETVVGGALLSLPWWVHILDGVVVGAHAIAAVAGAILGVHGVYRILRGRPAIRRVKEAADGVRT